MNVLTLPSNYTVEHGPIELGNRPHILITTRNLYNLYGKSIKGNIKNIYCLENHDIKTIETTYHHIPSPSAYEGLGYPTLVGFGGGTIIDSTKVLASKLRLPYISIPTTLSNDGICSPFAILRDGDKQIRIKTFPPETIRIPLHIVAKAPLKTLVSGVGDLISNGSAMQDWKLAFQFKQEPLNSFAYSMSKSAFYNMYNWINTYQTIQYENPDFLILLAESLMLSSMSMIINGNSRPCSGSEHEFSHALDKLAPDNKIPHGHKVAFGSLISESMREQGHITLAPLVLLLRGAGLPYHWKQLELPRDIIAEALALAPHMNPEKYTIFQHTNYLSNMDYIYQLLDAFENIPPPNAQ